MVEVNFIRLLTALLVTGTGVALILQASYQGCNDPTGVCYPPIEKTLSVPLVSR
ncbi:protein-disulfide reductase DsbD domain-containing protein [Allopusillimonas ginsengisoli]|uniref:protein-disulfide reductase DsbD domain-containing protein n=1 Tax=Allopusillimonas ginsengisoli TaxID=453575 RepID=UPI00101FAAFC|nr:hypothetical protein [Alcaligenaceae bacterium]TEA79278.1 hypothetical protein ERE07_07860 [Allopusillimonas ginsengisoli]